MHNAKLASAFINIGISTQWCVVNIEQLALKKGREGGKEEGKEE